MAFISFPGQTPVIKKTPVWSTKAVRSKSGRRRTRRNYASPLWRFELEFEVLRNRAAQPEVAELFALFNTQGGQAEEFYFIDPTDYTVVGGNFGTGNASRTQWQLTRIITGLVATFTESLYFIVGTPVIYVNGVATTAFTISAGLVTFTSAPAAAAVLTWTGAFMFRVAFDDDELESRQMIGDLWDLSSLKFTSVRF